jgi:hypothetical protein
LSGFHPFAAEIALAVGALAVFFLAVRGERSACRDLYAAVEEGASRAVRCHAEGNLTGERWRVALMALMAGVATYSVYAPPPPGPGHFWDPAQLTFGRVLFSLMITGHGMWVRVDRRTRKRTLEALVEEQM